VHNIRIVSGRLSNRSVVGDLGFRDLNSPDIWRRLTRFVWMDRLSVVVHQNIEVVGSAIPTNLVQCVVEVRLLPVNILTSLLISDLHRVRYDA